MTQFTIATMNAGPMKKNAAPLDLRAIATNLHSLWEVAQVKPDIFALQEVRRLWTEPEKFADAATEFASRMGADYRAFFAAAYDSETHPHPTKWKINALRGFLRAQQGNAIVSRLPHTQWPFGEAPAGYPRPRNGPSPIPLLLTEPQLYSTGDRNTEPRVALLGAFLVGSLVVYVLAVHLGTYTGERGPKMTPQQAAVASAKRTAQVDSILGVVQELRAAEKTAGQAAAPVICIGDLNCEESSEEIKHLLSKGFKPIGPLAWHPGGAGEMYSHTDQRLLIDHVFLSDPEKRLTCTRYQLLPEKVVGDATDHLPVYATFELT